VRIPNHQGVDDDDSKTQASLNVHVKETEHCMKADENTDISPPGSTETGIGGRARRRSLGGFAIALACVLVAAIVVARLVTGGNRSAPSAQPPPATSATTAPEGNGAAAMGSEQVGIPPQVDRSRTPVRSQRTARADSQLINGARAFSLTAEPVQWELIPGSTVTAWGYNGQVPGPEIWVNEGERVRIELTNKLPVATTIHWHGIAVPNEMDGIPGVTQDAIEPGETFTYEFDAKPSGTFWYHSHFDSARQLDMGLLGAFVIKSPTEPAYNKEFVQLIDEMIRLQDGRNGWEGVSHAGHDPGDYNWFTINGKAFPATENMVVKQGDRVRVRLINGGTIAHPMHLHGKRMLVVAKDGAQLPAPYEADTILIGPGERYDFEFVADDPGSWMFHCHILPHVSNDAKEPGGLMTFVNYEGYKNAYQQRKG
jgi:manganese oxidase